MKLGSEAPEDGENVSELLFNLASTDRLTLLRVVSTQRARLTELSKVIGASAQECSRHLARLNDSGLVRKGSDGQFEATPFGMSILRQLPSVIFLLRHKEYFNAHDLSFLPEGFVERIGDLSTGDHVNHFSQVLNQIKATITGAREYVWLISDQPIVVGEAVGTSFFSKDLPVKLVSGPTTDRKLLVEVAKALPKCELRVLPKVKIAMGINENVAGVIFPGLNDDIDFGTGFVGKDARFRAWCVELFEHYWRESKKVFPA